MRLILILYLAAVMLLGAFERAHAPSYHWVEGRPVCDSTGELAYADESEALSGQEFIHCEGK